MAEDDGNPLAKGHGPPLQRPPAPDIQFSERTAPQAPDDRIACPLCGSRNPRGLRFCVTCGHFLAHAPTLEQPSAPAVRAAPPSPGPAPISPHRVVELRDAGPAATSPRHCPRCHAASEGNAQFCRFCGAPLGEPVRPPGRFPEEGTGPIENAAPFPRSADVNGALSPLPSPLPPPAEADAGSLPIVGPRAQDTGDLFGAAPLAPLASLEPLGPMVGSVTVALRATLQTRPRLVLIARDGGEGPSYPLGSITDLGRTEGDVVIADDRYVSPRHARIAIQGAHFFLRDLGSTNGIFVRIPFAVEGQLASAEGESQSHQTGPISASQGGPAGQGKERGHSEQVLGDQELFLVGQQVLRFEVVKHAEEGFGMASENGTLLFGTPAAPRYARLSQRTVEGVVRDVFHLRKGETVIGRESGDVVFTDDPFLSRRHAAIRVHSESIGSRSTRRYVLADLGSSNGTFLQMRDEVRLRDGDHFRIGQQLFRFDIDMGRAGA